MLYHIVTYGCQMNLHESEKVAGILKKDGHEQASDIESAELIVFNTCCVRDTAEKRALGNIGALKPRKKKQKNLMIAVLGCMTQQSGFAQKLKQQFSFVDIILGTNNLHLLPYYIRLRDKKNSQKTDDDGTYDTAVSLDTFRASYPNAWVNIMYGCNNFCSYCIVPYVRGREVSRPVEDILSEVKFLYEEDYKEITLLGQNVNSYSFDGIGFAALLERISKVVGGKLRIRFMTSNPKDFDERLIDVISGSDNICKHIHLPVQAGSDKVLADMNRKYTRARYIELIKKINDKIPGVLVTTDLMVGFPTETDGDFRDTLELVAQCRFSQAFTFVYSPRAGTASADMPDLPYDIKKARIVELIKLQDGITKEISRGFHGNTVEILIESVDKLGDFNGRTNNGRLVTLKHASDIAIGDFVSVEINASKSASLVGQAKVTAD